MIDPIGSYNTIKDNFILYIKTVFGTRFDSLEIERDELLRQKGIISQEPWIEPLLQYISSGSRIDDLLPSELGMSPDQAELYKKLVKCGLFPDNIHLHSHQKDMLMKALSGRNCVVTAGTGSGKTEAFLLPLFAHLCRKWQHGVLQIQLLNILMTGGKTMTGFSHVISNNSIRRVIQG